MTRTTAPGIGRTAGAGISAFGRRLRAIATGAALGLLAALPATAQNQFAPVARVDGEVITAFERSQRMAFLTLLNAPGDITALAIDQLINEILQMRAARGAGIEADPEMIKAGMEEFAARGNLTADEFQKFLSQAGIAPETFRDFVTAGVTWREYVKGTLLPTVSLSEADIDAAMAEAVLQPGLRVLLSEIVLPAGDPATRKASKARAARLAGLDEAGFTDAAMRFSTGLSRASGGKMKWLDITALPPEVGAAVRGLAVGKISRPIEGAEDIRLYFLRDKDEVPGGTPRTVVEYAALLLAGGHSAANLEEVARIRARVTRCDDLYPIARALPPEQLVRETLPVGDVPSAYAAELEKLDPGEISTGLVTSSGAMVVLMLCSRGNELPRSLTREMAAEQMRNQRVNTLAQFRLEEMRANAHIEMIGN